MTSKNALHDLVTLLKVFDANFVTDEDCEKLTGLDINKMQGVDKAVQHLLLPEFLSYKETARIRLLGSLRDSLADSDEDFSGLFDRIELAFDMPINNKRSFMQALLHSLESGENF